MSVHENLAECKTKVYVATMSNSDELYFKHSNRRLTVFRGKEGHWIVWDVGETNAARLVIDENGRPAGFIPRMFSDGLVYGYVRKTIVSPPARPK